MAKSLAHRALQRHRQYWNKLSEEEKAKKRQHLLRIGDAQFDKSEYAERYSR